MTERRATEAGERLTEAIGESYRTVMNSAVAAQERNVNLAQNWAEGINDVLKTQAETNQALTEAMRSYVTVVDEALKSQQRTNQALTESLESYKEVIEKATVVQERSAKLAEDFFEGLSGELKMQTETNQQLAQDLLQSSTKQWEALQATVQESMNAYMNLLAAPFSYYGRAPGEGRQGE